MRSWGRGLQDGSNYFIRRGKDRTSTFALSHHVRLPSCEAGERPSPDAHTMLLGSSGSRIRVWTPVLYKLSSLCILL